MHRENRIAVTGRRSIILRRFTGLSHLPATVEHFLRPSLHFRVAALDGRKVEGFAIAAGAHRARRATTQADQHARPAKLDEQGARRERRSLEGLIGSNVADATGQHDGLVIAAHYSLFTRTDTLLVAAKVTAEIRAAKFVVEGRCANRAFEHDVQCRGNA